MKVYRIRPDVNQYQAFLPEDKTVWKSGLLTFDATAKSETWEPPPVFSLHPKLKRGDFWKIAPGALAATPEATKKVEHFFDIAGEMLPLFYRGEQFTIVNVLECIDCLDHEQTEWLMTDEGVRVVPDKYVFNPERFTDTAQYGMFKIPETCKGWIYVLECSGDPSIEFKAFVETEKMTGLLFDEIWPEFGWGK